jgi:hypothetical protein
MSTIDSIDRQTIVNKSTTVDTSLIEDNPLNAYASYVPVFTLSALTREEVQTLKYYQNNYKPQNVIAKTGGMGGNPNSVSNRDFRTNNNSINDTGDTGDITILPGDQSQQEILLSQLNTAKSILQRAFDFFFESVNINTVPSASNDRRLTAVTNIDMIIHEPLGLSLIQVIRGAAANAGFIDHVDAPYLITIDYKGFDENGKFTTLDSSYQRKIPIKLTKIEVDVNQSGSVYTIRAVPFNEFGLVNRFNYTRQDMLIKSETDLASFCRSLTKNLNDQTAEETKTGLYDKDADTADHYIVTCDPSLNGKFVELTTIDNYDMYDLTTVDPDTYLVRTNDITQSTIAREKQSKQPRGQIAKGTAIHELLIQVMKSIKPYDDWNEFLKQWAVKADGEIGDSIDRLVSEDAKATFLRSNEDKFYVDWFRVQTTITLKQSYDKVNKMHGKIIHYHIEPYKIHILNFAQPGLHSKFRDFWQQNRKFIARKKYDYIFTGQNTEILDLKIRYNVAYFASRFKALQQTQFSVEEKPDLLPTQNYSLDEVVEPDLPHRASPGVGKTTNVGLYGINEGFDQFLDAFTNPDGDMVQVDMEIRGDPIYISANQFNVMKPPEGSALTNPEGPGTYVNTNSSIDGATTTSYHERTRSFNLNQAEPFILINFKAPVDINLNTGLYEIGSADQVSFNGLYRVVKIENIFDRGVFKQRLRCIRMKDQGKKVSTPQVKTYVSDTAIGNVNANVGIDIFNDWFMGKTTVGIALTDFIKNKIDQAIDVLRGLKKSSNNNENNGGPPQVP